VRDEARAKGIFNVHFSFICPTSRDGPPQAGSDASPRIQPSTVLCARSGRDLTAGRPEEGRRKCRSSRIRCDTGASNCLFEREHAGLLNLEIETGHPKTFWTATGRVETFGHTVELDVLGLQVESLVYFFADERINRNLLGRTGWLDRVRFGLIDHDLELYLAAYDF